MGELKVVLREELLKAFKEKAYRLFGFKKGSIKEAAEIAIRDFVEKIESAEAEEIDISRLRGLLSDLKVSSVELQHKALELWIGHDPDRL